MTEKRKLPKGIWGLLIALILIALLLVMCGGSTTKKETDPDADHIYDNTEIIGTIAVTHVNKDDVTEEALEDYYFNFYIKNFFLKKHVIIFDDTDPVRGIDFIGGNIYYNVLFEENGDGTYTNISTDDDKENITVYHEEDDHLVTSGQ